VHDTDGTVGAPQASAAGPRSRPEREPEQTGGAAVEAATAGTGGASAGATEGGSGDAPEFEAEAGAGGADLGGAGGAGGAGGEPVHGGAAGASELPESGGAGGADPADPEVPIWKICTDEICDAGELCVRDEPGHDTCITAPDVVGHCEPDSAANGSIGCADQPIDCSKSYINYRYMPNTAVGGGRECIGGSDAFGRRWHCGPPL